MVTLTHSKEILIVSGKLRYSPGLTTEPIIRIKKLIFLTDQHSLPKSVECKDLWEYDCFKSVCFRNDYRPENCTKLCDCRLFWDKK